MAINDLYEITTHVRTAEGVMQFSYGYEMEAGVVNPETLPQACLKFSQIMLDKFVLAVSSDLEVDKVEMRAITNVADVPGGVNFNNLEGTLGGEAVPNSSAVVMHILTNAPNARHNGRLYLPGLVETDHGDGIIKQAALDLLQDFGNALLLDLILDSPETAEFTPVVISRFDDKIKRVPPIGHTVVSVIPRPNMKQQRRRGGRRFGLSG